MANMVRESRVRKPQLEGIVEKSGLPLLYKPYNL